MIQFLFFLGLKLVFFFCLTFNLLSGILKQLSLKLDKLIQLCSLILINQELIFMILIYEFIDSVRLLQIIVFNLIYSITIYIIYICEYIFWVSGPVSHYCGAKSVQHNISCNILSCVSVSDSMFILKDCLTKKVKTKLLKKKSLVKRPKKSNKCLTQSLKYFASQNSDTNL